MCKTINFFKNYNDQNPLQLTIGATIALISLKVKNFARKISPTVFFHKRKIQKKQQLFYITKYFQWLSDFTLKAGRREVQSPVALFLAIRSEFSVVFFETPKQLDIEDIILYYKTREPQIANEKFYAYIVKNKFYLLIYPLLYLSKKSSSRFKNLSLKVFSIQRDT